MKKTLIGLFLVLGAASFADAGKVEVKGGIDFGGKYHYEKDWRTQKTKKIKKLKTVQEKLELNTETK